MRTQVDITCLGAQMVTGVNTLVGLPSPSQGRGAGGEWTRGDTSDLNHRPVDIRGTLVRGQDI